jgi:uroporphyrinogen III methyltransferase / synthase
MNVGHFGTVYLVGAGPGDPGLLTVRAASLIAGCDCVVHDSLVNPAILDRLPHGIVRRDVGKRGGAASTTQAQINQLLVDLAGRHRRVLRLKGGDPFLFGRGGEEAAALAAAGIPFVVVPGVTSGIGVPAYAGIPVTHRAASSVVAFATGHQAKDGSAELDWDSLSRIETVVLYMGMHKLGENCAAMISHGRSPDTPAAAIQWGTYPRQRVVTGTLSTLPRLAAAAGLGAPAITVIGEVVRYRERIRWFDNRPLSGRRVAVTRAADHASELCELLEAAGAEVVLAPLARHDPPHSWDAMDAALARLGEYDWVAFTSANAVRFLWQRLRELGGDARRFARVRIAAVGTATASALDRCGLAADLLPLRHDAAALGEAMRGSLDHCVGNIPPTPALPRVLLPQADNARPALRDWLVGHGCRVDVVTAYRSLALDLDPERLLRGIDALTLASSATAERLVVALGVDRLAGLEAAGCRFIAIGAQTAETMRGLGIPPAAVAADADMPALVDAVIMACREPGSEEAC